MLYPSDMPRNGELARHESLVGQEIFTHLQNLDEHWNHLILLDEVDSTNAYIQRNINRVVPGNPLLVTADEQTIGIGRLQRTWQSPFGAGIALSLGVAQQDIIHELPPIPLIVGLAVHEALQDFGVDCALKWPNDVVFLSSEGLRKVGGILVQRFQHSVVVGIGLNVGLQLNERPTEIATSLNIEGYDISREELIAQIINRVHQRLCDQLDWFEGYRQACSSLGRIVRVTQIDNVCFSGTAIRIDDDGALVVQTSHGEKRITVGDVNHATVE